MAYLFSVLVTLALFAGFLALMRFEEHRGRRIFARARASLDARAERVEFIAEHVDFAAFIRDGIRAIIARVVHDIAHWTLLFVRFIERMLTRLVRALRARRAATLEPVDKRTASEFATRLKDFKEELRSARIEE